jgi:hypothetical protein
LRTYFVDVLASELRDQLFEAVLICLDTDSAKDLLDVGGGGCGVTTDLEEEVGSDMAHLQSSFSNRTVASV